MTKPIKLAIIGTGMIVKDRHLPNLLRLNDYFSIVALCNRTVHKAQEMAIEFRLSVPCFDSCQEILDRVDFDIALVCLPIGEIADVVRLILQSGKGVICEKPIADNYDTARELIALAQSGLVQVGGEKSSCLPYFVLENHRRRAIYLQMHTLIEQGKIGKAHLFHLNDLHYTPSSNKWFATAWRRNGKHRGGYLLDGGIHAVAAMRVLFPNRVKTLSAAFSHYFEMDAEPGMIIQICFDKGPTGQLALGDRYHDPYSRMIKIYGDKATLIANVAERRLEIWSSDDSADKVFIPIASIGEETIQMWQDIYSGIMGPSDRTSSHPFSAEEALKDLEILHTAMASAQKEGLTLALPSYAE